MLRKLVFFHTAEVHVATFDRLLAELAPGCPARHVVRADLLAEATAAGCLTDRLATESKAAMERELADPETLLLCTCSTLGPLADALAAERGRPALRVDRPMAERAVALGPRLLLAACLASTLDPTRRLLLEAAERAGREIVLREVVIEAAWPLFLTGDLPAYHAAIAQGLRPLAAEVDVVVLAQASMAGVGALLPDLATPLLSSPRLGLEAALTRLAGAA
jgi:hypothetical protein